MANVDQPREASARRTPDGPREGIYLDAALAVIGEQLNERIDEAGRRRRRRTQFGMALLFVATIASGSAAAVAITSRATDAAPEASVTLTAEGEIHCVDGTDPARPAYFTARYRTVSGIEVDPARLCSDARAAIATDDGTITSAPPAGLAEIADGLIASAATPGGPDAASEVTPDVVAVEAASFGVVSSIGGPHMIVCTSGDVDVVLAAPYGDAPTAPARIAACAGVAR